MISAILDELSSGFDGFVVQSLLGVCLIVQLVVVLNLHARSETCKFGHLLALVF